MVPTEYVFTEFGVYGWQLNGAADYVKYGSPKAGDKVTQEDLELHTKAGFGTDKLLIFGCMAHPGSSLVEKMYTSEVTLQEWIDSKPEAPMEPLWPSIDPHHHLQAEDPPPKGGDPIPAPIVNSFGVRQGVLTYDRLAKDMAGNNIVGTVFIEAHYMYDQGTLFRSSPCPPLGETRAVQAVADQSPVPMAIVSHIDLSLGRDAVKDLVAKHREVGKNLVGIRHNLAWHKDACVYSRHLDGQPEILSTLRTSKELHQSEHEHAGPDE